MYVRLFLLIDNALIDRVFQLICNVICNALGCTKRTPTAIALLLGEVALLLFTYEMLTILLSPFTVLIGIANIIGCIFMNIKAVSFLVADMHQHDQKGTYSVLDNARIIMVYDRILCVSMGIIFFLLALAFNATKNPEYELLMYSGIWYYLLHGSGLYFEACTNPPAGKNILLKAREWVETFFLQPISSK